MLCEILRRSNNRHSYVRPDPDRDHVLPYLFTKPHAGLDLARHDIGEAVIDDDLHLDVRVVRQELSSAGHSTASAAFSVAVMRTVPAGLISGNLKIRVKSCHKGILNGRGCGKSGAGMSSMSRPYFPKRRMFLRM